MLNWNYLTLRQKLGGALGVAFCVLVILALFRYTQPGRTPPIGLPLVILGWLLHPGIFTYGKQKVSWRGAPFVVKVVWAAAITALLVSVTSGVGRMLA